MNHSEISKNLPENSDEMEIFLSSPPNILSAVSSQVIWYNRYLKIDNNRIYNHCTKNEVFH